VSTSTCQQVTISLQKNSKKKNKTQNKKNKKNKTQKKN
jgi:hypothetical protein